MSRFGREYLQVGYYTENYFPDHNVRFIAIYYKFVGYLDIDPTQCHPNYTADIREGVAVEYVSCEPSDGQKELFPEQYGEGDDSFEEEETEQA